jgi:hypothetical protein
MVFGAGTLARDPHAVLEDGELSDRPASPHGDDAAGLDVGLLGGHVAGGKDVGQEEDLFV